MTKILVVDDEPFIRFTLKAIICSFDYEVIEAENGIHGLELMMAKRPSFVFIDYNMPNMNGYEFSRHVKTDAYFTALMDIPLVGYGDFPNDKKQYLDDNYVKGDFDSPSKLKSIIDENILSASEKVEKRTEHAQRIASHLVELGYNPRIDRLIMPNEEAQLFRAIQTLGIEGVRNYEYNVLTGLVNKAMHRISE